ncbi:MAG: hypothetical protein ACPHER_04085 [Nevskiales bacterium]
MIWAMAALVAVLAVLIWLGNLRLMISFLVTATIVVAALLVFDWVQDNRSASLIDFQMRERPGVSYGMQGRVQNHSGDYRLLRLALRVLALDCADMSQPAAQCTVIGEHDVEFAVDIPAGQARDVQQRIRFGSQPLQPRGTLRWQYEVIGTVGG